jgi:RNA-binding protein
MPPLELSGKQKRFLRGLAHPLKPVVQVGQKGLSESLLKQINVQLEIHELIKIKLGQDCPMQKKEASLFIRKEIGATVVQTIGRTLVLYQPRQKAPEIRLP